MTNRESRIRALAGQMMGEAASRSNPVAVRKAVCGYLDEAARIIDAIDAIPVPVEKKRPDFTGCDVPCRACNGTGTTNLQYTAGENPMLTGEWCTRCNGTGKASNG